MINEILSGLNKALSDEFNLDVYNEFVKNDFDTPSFVVQCIDRARQKRIDKRYTERVQFCIYYFQKNWDRNVNDVIDRLFECTEYINAENVTLERISYDIKIIDYTLYFIVTYRAESMIPRNPPRMKQIKTEGAVK